MNLAGRIFLILAAALLLISLFTLYRRHAQQEREAKYERALSSYSRVFHLGETRKEVESYLYAHGLEYQQMCCIDERSAFADLLRIGAEKAPWYCSEQNIYVALQFAAVESHEPARAYGSDALRKVSIFRWLQGCL